MRGRSVSTAWQRFNCVSCFVIPMSATGTGRDCPGSAVIPELMLLPVDPTGAPQSDRLPVDLKTWLNLPVVSGSDLTIRQLIRHVCDSDGGAHVDIKPLADLPGMGDLHQWMINISRYVSPLLCGCFAWTDQESHSPTDSQAYSRCEAGTFPAFFFTLS